MVGPSGACSSSTESFSFCAVYLFETGQVCRLELDHHLDSIVYSQRPDGGDTSTAIHFIECYKPQISATNTVHSL